MNKLLILFVSLILINCREEENSIPINAESRAVDSFEVSGIQSLSEFLTFKKINDSTLLGFDMQGAELNYYTKEKNLFSYRRKKHVEIQPRQYLPGFFSDDSGLYYTIDDDGIIYKYNKSLSLSDTLNLKFELPYLKDQFALNNYNSTPLIKHGDTIIATFANKGFENYFTYFKEPAMMELTLKGDSIHDVKCYMNKPRGLENNMYPWPAYCYTNNTIVMIYPCYDTIYTYNRNTKEEQKIALNNKNYSHPAIYDPGMLTKPNYFSYHTKYELANFRYEAIYYNELTKHYILIYKTPAESKTSNKVLTYNDQYRSALVLDEKFNQLEYLRFDKHYFEPANYFFCPGKGLAMPVFKSKNDYENTKFYIYNF